MRDLSPTRLRLEAPHLGPRDPISHSVFAQDVRHPRARRSTFVTLRVQSGLKKVGIQSDPPKARHTPTEVELITNQRSAFPRLEAIYILEPTPENVQRLARDFEPARPAQAATKKAPAVPASSGPKYAAAHVFFTDSELEFGTSICALGGDR